ncbi:class I glutamine amidotransferase-like protein [Dichomitus squalens]|uniref:Class I glutamine amidotransferase-like protein n=1 Tax=Dichomitus squalens TaxID=114155 RepID=A0A4Q9MDK2_9APHY|nr:class I glutamine amidotransferase-like protein [Dichomitus squalens]
MSAQQNAITSSEALPSKAGIVVFPGFEPLDAFGPIEALYTLSNDFKLDLYVIAATLDPVYTGLNDPQLNKAGSHFGVNIVPTHTHETVPDDLEVLLVPGGAGAAAPTVAPTVEFIKKVYPKLRYLITVCNGAAVAAAAGVLDGKRATTNKSYWKMLTSLSPNVKWVPTARYVVDGNCWTSGGVSAGIDVTLGWISKLYGEERARTVANIMEYEWRHDPNWDTFAYVFGVASA